MAVAKLKLLSISGSLREFEPALYMCINNPFLHIEDVKKFLKNVNHLAVVNERNPYTELLSGMENLASSSNLSLKKQLTTYEHIDRYIFEGDKNKTEKIINESLELDIAEVQKKIQEHSANLKSSTEALQNQINLLRENEKILEQTNHLSNIDTKMGDLFSFEFFKIRFGHMPKEAYNSINLYSKDIDDVFFIVSSVENNEVWGLYVTPKSKSVRIDSLFSTLHFERVRLSDKAQGTPAEVKIMLTEEIENLKKSIDENNLKLKDMQKETEALVQTYYEKLFILDKMFEMRKKTIRTQTSFHLTAWIPEDYVEEFTKKLEVLSTVVSPVNSPTDISDIVPPTLLKNNRIFKPFEQFVEMYGLPAYNEFDPTPLVAITYVLFYGIMFADLGQGFLLFLAGAFLWFAKKINFGRIGMCLGISSMCFGTLFGSLFGMEGVINIAGYTGYNPIEHINEVLIAAVILGVLTISAAIIMNIANGIKQKNIGKILFSQNGLAGLIFYWSVLIAALIMLEVIPFKISVTIIIFVVILSILAIYLREPLTHIVEKRKKIISENPVEFFIGNIFEVFEIILSFVTNTISFIRIGAFALSHVGMMSVVLLLAGGGVENAQLNPLVMILGNIFVMVLEGMLVAIQVLRLEFYEIFSRFFDGGGRRFEPSGLKSNINEKNR